jgi:hypothetical protein
VINAKGHKPKKIRAVGNNHNNSAENYIFAAFAETPFKYARAR